MSKKVLLGVVLMLLSSCNHLGREEAVEFLSNVSSSLYSSGIGCLQHRTVRKRRSHLPVRHPRQMYGVTASDSILKVNRWARAYLRWQSEYFLLLSRSHAWGPCAVTNSGWLCWGLKKKTQTQHNKNNTKKRTRKKKTLQSL